ncbi:MAG: DUF4876 domain-containing protein [Bacteroides sp.]|nr:DUF4876 domain-containing protein [Bacteroides sp.]
MTFNKNQFRNLFLSAVLSSAAGLAMVSCSDDDTVETYPAVIAAVYPAELPTTFTVESGTITYTEINTHREYVFNLPLAATDVIPVGTYDIDGIMEVSYTSESGAAQTQTLRAVASQQVISSTSSSANLKWFFYNPSSTLVFGEIYASGSLNAKGTGGLRDAYFTIFNNSDEVQYADGLAIVESKLDNGNTNQILTTANLPENNFTVQTVYVIPGSGKDVAIQPGESIKIVDQAIDWNKQVAGALNLTDADFEWFDEVVSNPGLDTDNPAVPNLEKWYSYSATIWIMNNQCNRSYALVRFPEGMTAEKFLAEQDGTYTYINASFPDRELVGKNCYLIKNEWIIDGVNLAPKEGWVMGALSAVHDASYAAISEIERDTNRFGKKFARKEAGVSAAGHKILMDTNDSAVDFSIVSVKAQ